MSERPVIRPRDRGDVPADPLSRLRHSASHVMADAVQRTPSPRPRVTIGPGHRETASTTTSIPSPFAPEDAEKIEAEMAKIIAQDLPFVRKAVSREEAIRLFEGKGETFKVEIIQSIPEGEEISLYQHGDFVDLCAGPARGSAQARSRLSRCSRSPAPIGVVTSATLSSSVSYGTAFSSKEDLKAHLDRLGRGQASGSPRFWASSSICFSVDELVGPGLRPLAPQGAPSSAPCSRT